VFSGRPLQPYLSARLGLKHTRLASVHRYLKDTVTATRATLLAEELESLRQLRPGTKKYLPVKRGEMLIRRGFARNDAGALVITTMGYAKLAFEITRASWFSATV
jgi:hypothetical protein